MNKVDLTSIPWQQYDDLAGELTVSFFTGKPKPIVIDCPASRIFEDMEGTIPLEFVMVARGDIRTGGEYGYLGFETELLNQSSSRICELARKHELTDNAIASLNEFGNYGKYRSRPHDADDVNAMLNCYVQMSYRSDKRVLGIDFAFAGVAKRNGFFSSVIKYLGEAISLDSVEHILFEDIAEQNINNMLIAPKEVLEDSTKASRYMKDNYKKSPFIRAMLTAGFGDVNLILKETTQYDKDGYLVDRRPMYIDQMQVRQSSHLEINVDYR